MTKIAQQCHVHATVDDTRIHNQNCCQNTLPQDKFGAFKLE
jgi:hypothetical protein